MKAGGRGKYKRKRRKGNKTKKRREAQESAKHKVRQWKTTTAEGLIEGTRENEQKKQRRRPSPKWSHKVERTTAAEIGNGRTNESKEQSLETPRSPLHVTTCEVFT